MEDMQIEISQPKIPLPLFMKDLEDKCGGGFPLGYIINIGSASGAGKTTVINEMIYYWIFNSPYKPAIISMELNKGQYGLAILSRHIEKKLALISDPQQALAYLNTPEVKAKQEELFFTEEGDHRFMLVDDRDGGLKELQNIVEELIVSCDCKLIVLDPLQDVLDGLSNEDQALFMKWMKGVIKAYNVTFININHVRKSGGGQQQNSTGADLFEEDFQGTSAIFKSGGCNILFNRDKYADTELEKNSTNVTVSKIRWTGYTGKVNPWYYDGITHKMYDLEDWMANNTSQGVQTV